MTALRVGLGGGPGPGQPGRGGGKSPPTHKKKSTHPKLTMRGTIRDLVVTVPYAPQGGSKTGVAPVYARQPRPGRRDEVIWTNDATPVLALDLTFMHDDFTKDIEAVIKRFLSYAVTQEAVLLHGVTAHWAGPWQITECTEDVQDLQPGTNRISKVVYHTTFTRASDVLRVGPATGGAKGGGPSKADTFRYVVKRGDTLHSIAVKQMGDATAWSLIAILNRLRSPKLHAGQVLRIPKKL